MEDKYSDWEVTTNRFVAFIDIMGFKDIVQRKKDEEVYSNLKKISDYSNDLKEIFSRDDIYTEDTIIAKNSFYITSFSDSIIVFSKNDNELILKAFTSAVVGIFTRIIAIGWGAKGVISYGNMTVDIKNSIYFGQPLIDAFLLQENLYYYGVLFHHTAEKYIKEHNLMDKFLFCFYCNTPIKSGKVKSMNLNWFSFAPESLNAEKELKENDRKAKEDDRKVMSSIMDKIYLNVSGEPRRYIDNTINIFEECIENYYSKRLEKHYESTR